MCTVVQCTALQYIAVLCTAMQHRAIDIGPCWLLRHVKAKPSALRSCVAASCADGVGRVVVEISSFLVKYSDLWLK